MLSRAHLARLATFGLLASFAACGGAQAPAAVPPPAPAASTSAARTSASGSSAPPSPFRATVLAGRHEVRRVLSGPRGRVYVATMDELFVFSSGGSGSGDRFRFHGQLFASPDGAQLYRTEGKELFAIDASGVDQRKVAFATPVEAVTPSPSGALLAVHTFEGVTPTPTTRLTLVRAEGLEVVASVVLPFGRPEPTWSPDGTYLIDAARVIDARTGKVVYEHPRIDRAAVFGGPRGAHLAWTLRDLLTLVDLEKGTSSQVWLPCVGETRADPEHQGFVTRCPGDRAVFTSAGGPPPTPAPAPPATPLPNVQDARNAAGPRFAPSLMARVLLEGAGMSLRDGELLVPAKGDPATIAARARIAPARTGGAVAEPKIEVKNGHIVVRQASGAPLADIAFGAYEPDPRDVTVVGDKVVVSQRGWNPSEPASHAQVCSFAGTCEAKFEGDTYLGVFGDELVASHVEPGGATLIRLSLATGARLETALPTPAGTLARSEDGTFYVAMHASQSSKRTSFTRIDAQSGKVTAFLEIEDPSYGAARMLGIVGERLVLEPDFGNFARVVLVDARSFEAKEHFLFGRRGALLHVRDDGSYDVAGDAAPLEDALICTDGLRFVPPAVCRHR